MVPGKRFNGATLLQAWRASPMSLHSSPARCFNGATLLQAWRGGDPSSLTRGRQSASMGPRFFKRGEAAAGDGRQGMAGASMGPRFFKRGEVSSSSLHERRKWRFNGATLLQAWRDPIDDDIFSPSRCFNGATLLQAWRVTSVEDADVSGLASMGPRFFKRGEGALVEHITEYLPASMGPRFFKRGEYRCLLCRLPTSEGFNGATLLQAWPH